MTNNATFIFIEKEKALNALRVNSLFYHLSVDLSVSIFSFYTLQYKIIPKKSWQIFTFFSPILKILQKSKALGFNLPWSYEWSHTKFGPDFRFNVYWIQTDKQTIRHAKYIYIDDGGIISVLVSTDVSVWDY